MRALGNFTVREWLRLLPLQHALKQLRNDVWLAAYQRRRPKDFDAFTARNAGLRDRNVVLVIAFEQPWVLGWLLDMAARHLQDATVLVFDNSRQLALRRDIERVCDARGVAYLGLPVNRTRHVNRSHGMAMSWVYANVVRAIAPRRFAFIDHDLIPIEPVSLSERLGSQAFFGLPVLSPWAWQLWAGYCLFDFAQVGRLPMNFLYDFSQGLDTGGRNWHSLYRQHPRDALRFATSDMVAIRDPALEPPPRIQVIDDRWLHIGGISYNDNFRSKSELCERLAQSFAQGLTWPEIRGDAVEPDREPAPATPSR
ncbi:hypothetical protein [Methylibium sp.]|uniref:hypothetical protein n=1 Tax=Methylibium sp. TaxID=2067992 RepID=UPI003D0F284B